MEFKDLSKILILAFASFFLYTGAVRGAKACCKTKPPGEEYQVNFEANQTFSEGESVTNAGQSESVQ